MDLHVFPFCVFLPPLEMAKSYRNKIFKKVIEIKTKFSYYLEVKNKPKNKINNFFFNSSNKEYISNKNSRISRK